MVACDEAQWPVARELVLWNYRLASRSHAGKNPYPLCRTIELEQEEFAVWLFDMTCMWDDERRYLRPLHLAAERGMIRLMAVMVERLDGDERIAALSRRTREWATPLHFAAAAGQERAARWLLDQGVNPSPRCSWEGEKGRTPLDLALRNDHEMVARLFLPHAGSGDGMGGGPG